MVVVVMGWVPGVGAGLVEVAVQGDGGVRVPREGELCVGSRQCAAQHGGDGRLVRAVPEGRRETSLAHRERSICEDRRRTEASFLHEYLLVVIVGPHLS